ncbi:MAG: hypothetical protein AAF065_11930 [Verrucomicrobiota bacterium]
MNRFITFIVWLVSPIFALSAFVWFSVLDALRTFVGNTAVYANHAGDIILPECAVGDLMPGQICLAQANAARFESSFYNEALTNYGVGGWDNDPLQELLEFYAPAVTVPERFNYKEARHKDHFLIMDDSEVVRAMGGDFKRVDSGRMNEVDDRLDEKGLVGCVDAREIEEDPDAEQKMVDRLIRILLRIEFRDAFNKLDAAATNRAVVYGAATDPDEEVNDDLLLSENGVGVRPNRVGYGSSAWSLRRKAYRAQNNAGGYASSNFTPEDLADYLMVQALAFNEARYRSSGTGLSTFIGSRVLMFNAASGLGKDDPSNIKRFVALTGGQAIMVFVKEFARKKEITVAHKSKNSITSTLGIRKQTAAAA